MRLCVCGGRDYSNWKLIHHWLDQLHSRYGIDVLMHGDANGADLYAKTWCYGQSGVAHLPFRANWDKYGKSAGSIRNEEMAEVGKPDLVLSFEGGRGTQNMISHARSRYIPTLFIPDPEWRLVNKPDDVLAGMVLDANGDYVMPSDKPIWLVQPDADHQLARKPTQEERDRYVAEAMF